MPTYPVCECERSHVEDKGLVDGRVSIHSMSSWAAVQAEPVSDSIGDLPLSQPGEPAGDGRSQCSGR